MEDRILAIVWIVICYGWALNLSCGAPRLSGAAYWFVVTVYFVLGLIGITASVLLFFGVAWARWLIGLVAFSAMIGACAGLALRRPLNLSPKIELGVAIISLALVLGRAVNIFPL